MFKRFMAGIILALALTLSLAACGDSTGNNGGAGSPATTAASSQPNQIENAVTAKDEDGANPTTTFGVKDTLYCVLTLTNTVKDTPVRFVWTAVDTSGGKNTQITENTIQTKGVSGSLLKETLNSKLTLPRDWPTGSYKVEVYVGGNLAKTLEFQIQ